MVSADIVVCNQRRAIMKEGGREGGRGGREGGEGGVTHNYVHDPPISRLGSVGARKKPVKIVIRNFSLPGPPVSMSERERGRGREMEHWERGRIRELVLPKIEG